MASILGTLFDKDQGPGKHQDQSVRPKQVDVCRWPRVGFTSHEGIARVARSLDAESTFERPRRPSTGFQVRWKRHAADE